MNIGEVARRTGLPAKTIRYYESIGLVRANRLANGYRDYSDEQLEKLHFVARSRALGFSLEECRTLLALQADENRDCADVVNLTSHHIDDVEQQIQNLTDIRKTLVSLVDASKGDKRTDCPILTYLAGHQTSR